MKIQNKHKLRDGRTMTIKIGHIYRLKSDFTLHVEVFDEIITLLKIMTSGPWNSNSSVVLSTRRGIRKMKLYPNGFGYIWEEI